MTDPTPPPPPDGATPDGGGPTPPETPPAATAENVARLEAALDKERTARKDAEKAARDALAQARAGMAEDQRKLVEAEEKGRAEVRAEYGKRLARTVFEAEAARRNATFDAAKALRYVDLAGMVGDDGEPDPKAIAAAVADLVPEPAAGTPTPPSFDGGVRTTAPSNSTAQQFAATVGSLLT
jgi:membrane protein involved in colicin uptake